MKYIRPIVCKQFGLPIFIKYFFCERHYSTVIYLQTTAFTSSSSKQNVFSSNVTVFNLKNAILTVKLQTTILCVKFKNEYIPRMMLFGRFLECEPNMNSELSVFCANASWQNISHKNYVNAFAKRPN